MTTHMDFINGVINYAVTNPQESIPIIVFIAGWLAAWQRTGRAPIGRLPWRYIRATFNDLRYVYFDVPRQKGVPGVVTDKSAEEVDKELRENHHFEGSPYGYYYDNEVLSIRRPDGIEEHPKYGDDMQMVLHPRAFGLSDGRTLWLTHREPSRYEEHGIHLSEKALSWPDGQEGFSNALSEADIDHEKVDSENSANLKVVSPDKKGDGFLVKWLKKWIPS